jgi:hypothetical protein
MRGTLEGFGVFFVSVPFLGLIIGFLYLDTFAID